MQTDSAIIHQGVTELSHAASKIHMITGQMKSVVQETEKGNSSPKFRKCRQRINEIVIKLEKTGNELFRVNQILQRLEYIVREMEE